MGFVHRRLLDDSLNVLCADRYRKRCNAHIITRNSVVVKIRNGAHIHRPDLERITAVRVKSCIRRRAVIKEKNGHKKIFHEKKPNKKSPKESCDLSEEELHMPKTEILKRTFQKTTSK